MGRRSPRVGWLGLVFSFLLLVSACGDDVVSDEATSSQGGEATGTVSSSSAPTISSPPTSALTTSSTTTPSAANSAATASSPTTAAAPTDTTSVPFDGALDAGVEAAEQVVRLHFESMVDDVSADDLRVEALTILNDPKGWPRAGFRFVADNASPFRVVLAEGAAVDRLCLPLVTYGTVSCQNGPVVALNATRWRSGVEHWDGEVIGYRGYLVNHEVGHLLGQRHPKPRCPVTGRLAGVMEQQTAGLEGCIGNAHPRDWEIERAQQRPVVYAPLPDWGPDPVPDNLER